MRYENIAIVEKTISIVDSEGPLQDWQNSGVIYCTITHDSESYKESGKSDLEFDPIYRVRMMDNPLQGLKVDEYRLIWGTITLYPRGLMRYNGREWESLFEHKDRT